MLQQRFLIALALVAAALGPIGGASHARAEDDLETLELKAGQRIATHFHPAQLSPGSPSTFKPGDNFSFECTLHGDFPKLGNKPRNAHRPLGGKQIHLKVFLDGNPGGSWTQSTDRNGYTLLTVSVPVVSKPTKLTIQAVFDRDEHYKGTKSGTFTRRIRP